MIFSFSAMGEKGSFSGFLGSERPFPKAGLGDFGPFPQFSGESPGKLAGLRRKLVSPLWIG
jgi:hypothetical protein